MTNREYKERLNQHIVFGGADLMTNIQRSGLGRNITSRKHSGEIILE